MRIRVFTLIVLLAATAFGQRQTEEEKHLAMLDEQIALMKNPSNLKTEVFEAESDEYKVWVYRLLVNVPERKPTKTTAARKAEWVAVHFRAQVTYYVATSERREAQTEAMMLGADMAETMKIDREHYEAEGHITGKTTEIKLKYFAGTKLVASQDVMMIGDEQANQIINRIRKLEKWARLKSGN